jgi:uncharacterized protein (DUF849 family)
MWPPEEAYIGRKPTYYKKGGVRFPAVPTTVEQQVKEVVEAVRAGCALAHIHPRDPRDSMATHQLDLYARIYDDVLKEVDVVSCQHTWFITPDGRIDYVSDARRLLEMGGGNRYVQSAVVLWPPADAYPPGYAESVTQAMRFYSENKIKPVHKIRGSYHLRKLTRLLIDTGIAGDGVHILVHDMGHPFGWPMDIPPWWPIDMIASLETTKSRVPNSLIGVYSGGRNWMPITFMAILMGVDLVRVGIEDCYWMYPHRDDVIQRNIDAVEKVTSFCRLIGRPIATVTQAREMMGIERTS